MRPSKPERHLFALISGAILIGLTIAPVGPLAADKAHDWKTGRVLDSVVDKSIYTTGATVSDSGNVRIRNVRVKTKTLIILGDDYAYTIEDTTQRTDSLRAGSLLGTALANRKHGCRFIVGEDIKYAQEKDRLYILDVDGKECKRQEKRN